MRIGRSLNLVLLVALLVASILAWPHLPDRIPVHFGLDGTPDRWARTTLLSWFAMPLVALALNLLLYGVTAVSSRNVRHINLPGKERLLRLPEARRKVVLAELRAGLELLCLPLTFVFCLIQLGSWRAAFGHDVQAIFIAVLILMVLATPALTAALLVRVQSAINRQVAMERRGRSGFSGPATRPG